MDDRYLRKLLVSGACSVLFRRKGHNDALRHWADQLLTRKSVSTKFKLVAVALAVAVLIMMAPDTLKGAHRMLAVLNGDLRERLARQPPKPTHEHHLTWMFEPTPPLLKAA